MPTKEESFITWLENEIERRGWTLRETARRAGLSHAAISNVLNRQRNPGWDFCAALSRAFEMPPEWVFWKAGLLERRIGADMSIEEIAAIVRQLPKEAQEDVVWFALNTLRRQRRAGPDE